jgi:hypothetical protein
MNPIFSEPWWLDAVAPGTWSEISVTKSNSAARLVYVRSRHRSGLVKIENPPLSPRLGPLIDMPRDAKLTKRIADQKILFTKLIAELPQHDYFIQACTPQFDYWLPFHWAGFRQTTQYSYVIDDLSDEDLVWRGLSQNHRRAINKGSDQYEVRFDLDGDVLVDLLRATFARQGLGLGRPPSLIKRLFAAVMDHDAGRFVVATDRSGRPLAGGLIVWDAERAYYLLGGRADHDGPDAMPLVLWNGIKLGAKVAKSFDFEGSMIEGIENFFRGFGGRPEAYSVLTHTSRRMELALGARQMMRAIIP